MEPIDAVFVIAIIAAFLGLFGVPAAIQMNEDKTIMEQPASVGTVDEVTASGKRQYVEIDGEVYELSIGDEPVPGEGSEVLYHVNDDRVIDIEKVSGSDAADAESSAESGADDAEDAAPEDLLAKAGTVSDAFTVDKTERYVEIDGNAYLLDESIETVPAKGSKILYRVDAGRIVEIKRADGASASE